MSARTPQEMAELAARTMWATDKASQGLGLEIVSVGPGVATLAMVVGESMTNGHGAAHGGFLFALADSAFAFACNSYGETTVAAHCSISFIKPGRRGDRLVASAREISRSGRSGIYDVTVRCGDDVLAEFRGHSRTVGGSFVEASASP